jgi:hypothetical protein
VQILAVGRGHLDARGGAGGIVTGDVAVGEDEAVRRHDNAGTGAAAAPSLSLPCAQGSGRAAMNGKAHDGRADAVDYVDDGP